MPQKKLFLWQEIPFEAAGWGRTKHVIGPGANGAEHIRIAVTEYDPNTPHEPHSHPGQEEAIWVLSGRGYSETGEERMALFPGAVAYIPSGMEHKTAAVGGPMTAIIIKGPVEEGKVS